LTVIRTARLELREMGAADAVFIAVLLNQPCFIRFIGDRGVRNEEDARRYICEGPVASYRAHGFGLYLVQLTDTRTPVGICGLLKRAELDDPDIGFAVAEPFQGNGYAFEAAAAVIAHSRDNLDIGRIGAITLADNEASIRLLQKLGLEYRRAVRIGDETLQLYMWCE
jgi:ribosomal-protein-alanine N-acetyltransferase